MGSALGLPLREIVESTPRITTEERWSKIGTLERPDRNESRRARPLSLESVARPGTIAAPGVANGESRPRGVACITGKLEFDLNMTGNSDRKHPGAMGLRSWWFSRRARKILRGALLCLVLLLALQNAVHLSVWTMDDAYISFRYSKNLANGFGLVHNIGQPVKGFSNTLWTLLMTLPECFGASPLLFSKILGGLSLMLMILLSYAYGCSSFRQVVSDHSRESSRKRARERRGSMPKRKSSKSRRHRKAESDGKSSGERHKHRSETPPPAGPQTQPEPVLLPILPCFLISMSAPIVAWSMSGMELGLHACLIVAAVMRRLIEQGDEKKRPYSALLFCSVVWSRPEGIAFFVAMAVHDICVRAIRRRFRLQDLLWYAIPVAAYLGELAVSSAYYGDPYPNTYYAKLKPGNSSFSSLLKLNLDRVTQQFHSDGYLTKHVMRFCGKGVIVLGFLAVFRIRRLRHISAFLLMIAAQIAFICRMGYDWMTTARFIVPLLPFAFLLTAETLYVLTRPLRPPWRGIPLIAGIVLVAWLIIPMNRHQLNWVRRNKPISGANYLQLGRTLASFAEPGRSLACFDIGGVGYATAYDIIDTAGLTNHFIARHNRGGFQRSTIVQAQYLLACRPDLIRRHRRQQPDQLLSTWGLRDGRYLAFENPERRFLIRRDLVLLDELPEDAVRVDSAPQNPNVPSVSATRLTEACRPGDEVWGTLFWVQGTGEEPPFDRRIELRHPTGQKHVVRSTCIAKHLGRNLEWRRSQILADAFRFNAPSRPGTYTLVVTAGQGNPAQTAASFVVVAPMEADTMARELSAQATKSEQQGRLLTAIAQAEAAARLTRAEAERDRYISLVVRESRELRKGLDEAEPDRAMALLNRAKFLLNRAALHPAGHTEQLHLELSELYDARLRLVRHLTSAWKDRADLLLQTVP